MKLIIFQATKHIIVGIFATLVDLLFFEILIWVFPAGALIIKAVSFIASTLIKYGGNKYWAFEQHQKEYWQKEAMVFFFITLVGLGIDITAFFYLTHQLIGQAVSVLLAAVIAGAWNFLGYKFLVFKK